MRKRSSNLCEHKPEDGELKRGQLQRAGGQGKQKKGTLVAEVVREEQLRRRTQEKSAGLGLENQKSDKGKKIVGVLRKKGCTCGVKDFLKELVKKLKGYDANLAEFKKDLALRKGGRPANGVLQPCSHDPNVEIKAEQQV